MKYLLTDYTDYKLGLPMFTMYAESAEGARQMLYENGYSIVPSYLPNMLRYDIYKSTYGQLCALWYPEKNTIKPPSDMQDYFDSKFNQDNEYIWIKYATDKVILSYIYAPSLSYSIECQAAVNYKYYFPGKGFDPSSLKTIVDKFTKNFTDEIEKKRARSETPPADKRKYARL